MLAPRGTAAAIDDFESRFTSAHGGYFMIAANGREAYPISEAESLSFRAHYRRRMQLSRWLRRGALLAVIPLLILFGNIQPDPPGRMALGWQIAYFLVFFGLPIFAFAQHPILSDLTKLAIERPLMRRITTRHAPAVTPVATPLGALGKKLLITAFAIEAAIMIFHAFGPRAELAAHMRVLYGLRSGDESWTAQLTGNFAWAGQLAILVGVVLMMIDRRRRRRAAERAKAVEEAAAPVPRQTEGFGRRRAN